jgi:hypothetical protein
MNPFSRVVTSLLEGQFICPVTDQEGYQYLTSSQLTNGRTNLEEIDHYLRRLDLRITMTRGAGAYFAAHADIDNEGKKAAKKRFTELKNILRPMVSFLEIVMRIAGDDSAVSSGQKLDLNRMMGRIAANASLTEQLRQTAIDTGLVSKDGSDRERLNRIVRKFQNDGFLCLVNPESEIYMFTGRIEWLMEAIEYLMQHDKISDEDSDFEKRVEA